MYNDVGAVFVQTFEATLRNWMGLPCGMCVSEKTCGYGLALEYNGDLYACDHFVETNYLLGNIGEYHMIEMVGSEQQYQFGQAKHDSLPKYCLECPELFACHGECPKNRFVKTPAGESGLNYLCAGYKAFFQRVAEPMKIMAMLLRSDRSASDVMRILAEDEDVLSRAYQNTKPEQYCPCNSGVTFQECHGWSRSSRSRRKRAKPAGGPRPPARSVKREARF